MRNIGFLPLLLLGACAGTTIEPVAYPNAADPKSNEGLVLDNNARGLRYYEGAHFVIVYSDGKGGLKSEVKFLPDLTKKRSIDPYAYFSKNETTLVFTNGMLVQSKSVIDETVLPKAAVTALEKVATASILAFNQAEGKPPTYLPFPKIYKIAIDSDKKLTLVAGKTVSAGNATGIQVTPRLKEDGK